MDKITFENQQIPLHYQIADYLLNMLKQGELDPGENLPPEEELRKIFSVSRTTIRRALEHLLNQGLLFRKQGKGTFWTEKAHSIHEEKLSGINREIFNITGETSVRVLGKEMTPGSPEVRSFLGLPEGEEVVIFRRVRYTGSEPMSYTVNYLPARIGDQVRESHLEKRTMLETLESVCGIGLSIVKHEVEVTRASSEIAGHLGIAVLDPVLTVNTTVFERDNSPVEIVWSYFVENKYKFRVVFDQ